MKREESLPRRAGVCATWSGILLTVLTAALTATAAAAESPPAPGLWQGAEITAAGQTRDAAEFLVLDTGGSGGGFGHGDIRQALHDVAFRDIDNGWACGFGGVFRTRDGGLSWTRVLPAGQWYQVEVSGERDVWLLEGRFAPGKFRRSRDDGQSWQEVEPGKFGGGNLSDLYCRNGQYWLLCGGIAWRSEDGETWRKERFDGSAFTPAGLAIPGEYEGGAVVIYTVGSLNRQRVVLKSSDNGKQWERLRAFPAMSGSWRNTIFFAGNRHGWIGGENGQLWRTRDGGANWTACPLPVARDITALWFDASERGYVAVANSNLKQLQDALYKTCDGGATWRADLNGAKQINRFCSAGSAHLWGVGDVPCLIPNDLVIIRKSH